MENLFVYGTLRDARVQKEVFGRIIAGTPDRLYGFTLTEIEIEGEKYPVAEPATEGCIDGMILVLTRAELEGADAYETAAYKRVKIVLESKIDAWVYVKNANDV
jgi:gamma-glutamylcyclotransferase (GGCT)/AIG2-like uncharacterized protein YtfP